MSEAAKVDLLKHTVNRKNLEIQTLKIELEGALGSLEMANKQLIAMGKQLEKEKHDRNIEFTELNLAKHEIAHYKTLCSQKNFPIQPTHGSRLREEGTVIPYWLAEEAYKYYSHRFGTDQTLERLSQRGGFGRKELLMFLRKKIE
jgi:hypothetical protein